jgi:hypothetical protein
VVRTTFDFVLYFGENKNLTNGAVALPMKHDKYEGRALWKAFQAQPLHVYKGPVVMPSCTYNIQHLPYSFFLFPHDQCAVVT